ncbi:amino acid ABC transporter substrate-binding protein, partial [Klebsiella quasipneumoniae]
LGDALILPARLSPGRASCALGDLATDAGHPAGEGKVMLRPEQLSVSVSGPQESTATIRDVDFSGQLSTLTLSMSGHDRPIVLRTVSQPAWQPGATVRLTVSGKARVFSG